MIKKFFPVLVLGFLLVGCTNNESNQVNTEEKLEQEVKVEKLVKEKTEMKTNEQYLSEFEASAVYQERTQGTEVIFTEVVDFEGDEIPEIVLGTNDEVTECNITIYKIEKDEWIDDMTFTYNSHQAIFLEPLGNLTYDDETKKEALAFSRTEAHASSMSQSFSILNYSENTNTIEELIRMPLDSTDSLIVNLDKNTFTVTSKDGSILDYIFKNGEIVDSNGEPMGIIIDEDLAKLVGTTINNHFIRLDDSYFQAKSKITEPVLDESYYEGGMCSAYETFFICDYEGGMYAYHITPANEVTIDDLSKFFNQTLEVSKYENLLEGGYSYTAEVMTESGMYNLEFNLNTTESLLESMTYIPN